MSLIIHQQFHRIKEYIEFAFWLCNDLKYPSIKDENPRFLQAKEIHQRIVNQLSFNEDEQRFFTKCLSGYNTCLAHLLVFSFLPMPEIESLNCKQLLINKFQSFDLSQFPEFILTPFGLELQENHQPFVELIRQLEIDESQKLEFFYSFYNYPKAIEELFTILEKIDNIASPYLDQLEKDLPSYSSIEASNICGKLLVKYGIKNRLEESDQLHLYPCLCWYSSLSITSLNQFPDLHIFCIGYAYSLEDYLKHNFNVNQKQVQEFLKLIADPSKLEILKLIKQTPRYGQELANLLNLKTSTISYHMEALLNARIINIERKNNRYYYSLEKDEISALLDTLHQLLC